MPWRVRFRPLLSLKEKSAACVPTLLREQSLACQAVADLRLSGRLGLFASFSTKGR
jgi:hypothetical protein